MNLLTSSNVDVADKLFTTLDTTTRKLIKNIIITDTIGFIKNIPPWLILSFRSTIDEIRNSNCILLMFDVSDSYEKILEKFEITESILKESKQIEKKKEITLILNKIDLISKIELTDKINNIQSRINYPIIPISVKFNIGVEFLINYIANVAKK
jgi:GTP-binding protein HflX